MTVTFDKQVDPRAELERLIVDNTCEWCGDTKLPQLTASGSIVYIQRAWLCREQKQRGYTSKHWRMWRVCDRCAWQGSLRFDKWIFPVIANMPTENLMEQLIAVQPMQAPPPQLLYMDLLIVPQGVRLNPPERHPLLRRYAEVDFDPRNYGRLLIDAAADMADTTVYEGQPG